MSSLLEHDAERVKLRVQQARQQVSFHQREQLALSTPAPHELARVCLGRSLTVIPSWNPGLARPETTAVWIATDPDQQGSWEHVRDLRQQSPETLILVDDCVVDEYQVLQAREAGANGLILHLGLLGGRRTELYQNKVRTRSLTAVVAVTSLLEVEAALAMGARVILVYSPDLELFQICAEKSPRSLHLLGAGQPLEQLPQLATWGYRGALLDAHFWAEPGAPERLYNLQARLKESL
jgi:hypothetical protein